MLEGGARGAMHVSVYSMRVLAIPLSRWLCVPLVRAGRLRPLPSLLALPGGAVTCHHHRGLPEVRLRRRALQSLHAAHADDRVIEREPLVRTGDAHHAADMALYRRALELREQRLKSYGTSNPGSGV